MGFGDYNAALEMRDIIQRLVREEVDRIRPKYEMAEVVTINRNFRYCTVLFPGDTAPIKVSMGSIQPVSVGQLVRIEGLIGDRFIADVIGPVFSLSDQRLTVVEDTLQNGPNLILNPGFESDFADWSNFWGPVNGVIETRGEHVFVGTKARRYDLTLAANKAVQNSTAVPCEPGVPVTVSYRVKRYGEIVVQDLLEVITAPTQAGAAYFGTGSQLQQPIPWYAPGTGYEIKQTSFIPPAGHYFFSIVSQARILTDGPGSIWYDDYKAYQEVDVVPPTLDDLTGVIISSSGDPVAGSFLYYNGTWWEDKPGPLPVETRIGSHSVPAVSANSGGGGGSISFSPAFDSATNVIVSVMLPSARLTWAYASLTTSGFTLSIDNHSNGASSAGTAYWKAERYA